MKDFPCTKCSQCCKRVGEILDNKEKLDPFRQFLVSKFPYKTLEDGSCEKLTEDGLCSVYEDRPVMCNTKRMSKFHKGGVEEYYQVTAEICNVMIEQAGLDSEYLIDTVFSDDERVKLRESIRKHLAERVKK